MRRILGISMFFKKSFKIKPSRVFSYFALENVDLFFCAQLLETIEKRCLSPNIVSIILNGKSLDSAIALALYAVHFMGAPVHVDK